MRRFVYLLLLFGYQGTLAMEVRIDELNALIDFVNDKTHLDGYTKEWGGETSWNLSKIATYFNTDRFSIIHRFKVAKIPHYPIDEIIPHYNEAQGDTRRVFVGRNITGLDIRRNRQIHDAYKLAFLFDSRGFKRGSIFVFSHNNIPAHSMTSATGQSSYRRRSFALLVAVTGDTYTP